MIRTLVLSIFYLLFLNNVKSQENKANEFEILYSYMSDMKEWIMDREVVVFDKTDKDLNSLYLKYWEYTETDTLINRNEPTDFKASFILDKTLKKKLIEEIKKDSPIDWNIFQFPNNFKLIEYKNLPILDNLKPLKRKIALLISKPILFENGNMAVFKAWEIYGSEISGTPTLQFYKKKGSTWVKFSELAWASF